jgi:aminopeptidase N
VRVTFADTMTMSTYLVAFVVGPLEATEPVDADGVPLRIVHRPGKQDLTAFAKDVGAFSLRFFATTTASRTPTGRWTWSGCPTSRRARWRTSAA